MKYLSKYMFAVELKAHIVSHKEEALGENLLLVLREVSVASHIVLSSKKDEFGSAIPRDWQS